MKYIDAEKLVAEIERLKKLLEGSTYYLDNSQQALGYSFALDDFDEFIDTLPEQEHPIYELNQILLDWVREAKTDKEQEARFEAYKRFFELYDEYMEQEPEQPVLPGIDEEGIPGKDFIPVEWVDACERYGKWKIVSAEQPVGGLEEAAEKYTDKHPYATIMGAFIAGAEWGMNQCPLPEDTTIFNKGVAEGKRLMMEGAVECMVMDFSSNLPRPQVDIRLDPGKYYSGDKVKVIVIKEEEQ